MTKINKIYCDMDGVVCDFSKGVKKIMPEFIEGVTEANKELDRKMWAKISIYQKNGGKFWYDLEPMQDAFVLWNFIKQFDVEILTAAGNTNFNADPQKIRWIKETFGNVKTNVVRKSGDKAAFASPTAILIDDKHKALDPWIAAGGIGILHTSAENTINELKKLKILVKN